jgi:hypothetical protein
LGLIFLNHKQSLLDLCERNALRYAIGEINLTMDLHAQLEFLYENSNSQKKELLDTIFQIVHHIEKGLLD